MILIACEFSGVVRDAFIKHGYDAISCDLLPTQSKGPHIQGNVIDIINNDWDMIIAHPPCTYLANSGVGHLKNNGLIDRNRWIKMTNATNFFKQILNNKCKYICIENPILHHYAIDKIGRKYDQLIHPWMFGHMEQKSTCLWLKNLPKLVETNNVKTEMMKLPIKERQKMHWLPPSPNRGYLRSITYSGIAEAMATQWIPILKNI